MNEVIYKVNVEKGYEFSTKVLIDLLFHTNSIITGNNQITVALDVSSSKRVQEDTQILEQLSRVKLVKA
jgi:hypothetical protein